MVVRDIEEALGPGWMAQCTSTETQIQSPEPREKVESGGRDQRSLGLLICQRGLIGTLYVLSRNLNSENPG